MPSNTKTVCTQKAQLNSKNARFNQRGSKGKAQLNTVTNVDMKVLDDVWLTGGKLLAKNAYFGDYCDMQVIDIDGVYAPAGTVLNQFVTAFYLDDSKVNQGEFDVPYTAKILAGLYMRLVYHSTGGMVQPEPAVNYAFHTILDPVE